MVVILFLVISLLVAQSSRNDQEQNSTSKFNIDAEIDKIMHAPPEKRRILMNRLKRKIYQLNLEIQSSQLLNLQHLLNTATHRGRR